MMMRFSNLSPLLAFSSSLLLVASSFPLFSLISPRGQTYVDLSPRGLLTFPDNTLFSVSAVQNLSPTWLNAAIRFLPDADETPTFGQLLARFHPNNGSVLWAVVPASLPDAPYPYQFATSPQGVLHAFDYRPRSGVQQMGELFIARYTGNGDQLQATLYQSGDLIPAGPGRDVYISSTPGVWVENTAVAMRGSVSDRMGDLIGPVREQWAVFIDLSSGATSTVQLPLPAMLFLPGVASEGVVGNLLSGTACFVTTVFTQPLSRGAGGLVAHCVLEGGRGEVVTRMLEEPTQGTRYFDVRMLRGVEGELVVVATRIEGYEEVGNGGRASGRREVLLFKVREGTLEDGEWSAGEGNVKRVGFPAYSTVQQAASGLVQAVVYLEGSDSVVFACRGNMKLFGLEATGDGEYLFRGELFQTDMNSFQPPQNWLVYVTGEGVATASQVPQDPRPEERRSRKDYFSPSQLTVSTDGTELYIFGEVSGFDGIGQLVTIELYNFVVPVSPKVTGPPPPLELGGAFQGSSEVIDEDGLEASVEERGLEASVEETVEESAEASGDCRLGSVVEGSAEPVVMEASAEAIVRAGW